MAEHEVVVESGVCMYAGIQGIDVALASYTEAKKSGLTPQGCLRVRLPVGYVDACTANGNHYEGKEISRCLESGLKDAMKAGLIHGAHGEHPKDRADLRPDEISHLITDMWVEEDIKVMSKDGKEVPTLWNEWLVIPTQKAGGADLIQLFLAGASVGTSIRGTAVREEQMYMRHYNFKGTDTVGVPSTGLFPGINNEKMKATISYESVQKIQESSNLSKNFNLISLINEGVNPMGSSLSDEMLQISESLKSLDGGKGSDLISLGVKMGALEGRISELERSGSEKDKEIVSARESLSEVNKIKSSLESEKDNAVRELESFKKTIDELKVQIESTESTLMTETTQKQTAISVIKEMRDRYNQLLETKNESSDDDDISIVRDYALKAEELIRFSTNYIHTLESALEQVKDYALTLEEVVGHAANKVTMGTEEVDKCVLLIEGLRDLANAGQKHSKVSQGMESWIGHLLDKYPKLKHFKEELRECDTVAQVEHRVSKYLDMIDKSGLKSFQTESVSESEEAPARSSGVERLMGNWR